LWPTPVANDDNKSVEAHLAMKARMKGGPRHTITSLQVAAKQFATPQSRDFRTGQAERWDNPGRSRNLNDQMAKKVAMFRTPTVAEAKNQECSNQVYLQNQVGANKGNGKLSVSFVEWLMGYPLRWSAPFQLSIVWTDLKDSETQSSPK